MQTQLTPTVTLNSDICSEESIAFLMLSEVMRARCQDILNHLKEDQIDITNLRRIALHIRLSADDLIREPGLLKEGNSHFPSNDLRLKSAEPASLQSVFELCFIAAHARLGEQHLFLESIPVSQDQFICGNPWEIAYAMFTLIRRVGSVHRHSSSGSGHSQCVQSAHNTIRMELEWAEGFAVITIPSESPLDPSFLTKPNHVDDSQVMSHQEWFCLRRLLEKNNIQLVVQHCTRDLGPKFCIILKLPTFQPGYEDMVTNITKSESVANC